MDTQSQSQSQSQTHQTITATIELSVPLGDYCLTLSRSLYKDCVYLESPFGNPRCQIFRTKLEASGALDVYKCTKCKEAKVKI